MLRDEFKEDVVSQFAGQKRAGSAKIVFSRPRLQPKRSVAARMITTRRILFLGASNGTSLHRQEAFKRAGCDVLAFDPAKAWTRAENLMYRLEWKVAPEIPAALAERRILTEIQNRWFDIIFVDNGSLVSRSLLRKLRDRSPLIINYNHDDPFGERDGVRFRTYRNALGEYDLVYVVRETNVAEAYTLGAKRVERRYMTYDRVAHAPTNVTEDEKKKWKADVAFVGTWMPERGPILSALASSGFDVAIYGNGWHRAPEWPSLQRFYRGSHLIGRNYNLAIQCAGVSIGLVSKGNRDSHTTRTFEIPALGAALCAEYTTDHASIFEDGREACLWSSVDECVLRCRELIADPALASAIAKAGQMKVLKGKYSNDDLIQAILLEA